MLSYQPTLFKPTEELTPQLFSQLIIDDHTLAIIRMVRQLKADTTTDHKAEIARLKRQLPMIIWQCCGFDETISRGGKGLPGRWRKQAAARLNGLFMLDIDHVEQPAELFNSWWKGALSAQEAQAEAQSAQASAQAEAQESRRPQRRDSVGAPLPCFL